MKKLIFFLLFLIVLVSHAQNGIRLGTNYATYDYKWVDDLEFSLGFYCGLVSKLKLSNRFAVQPELNYYQSGYKLEFEYGPYQWSQKWTNHWASLGTNFELLITRQFGVIMGASCNYKLLSVLREKGNDYSNLQIINYKKEDYIDRILICTNIGLCYVFNDMFLIDLRYDASLLDGKLKFARNNFRQLIKLGVGVLF